jgi:hypothetical protein
MVHALKEIWRVLVPCGQLIDIRPRTSNPDVELVLDDSLLVAGQIDDSRAEADYDEADKAIATVISDELFVKQEERRFSFAYYWPTPEQMQAYIEDNWGCYSVLPSRVVQRARDLSPEGQLVRCRVREATVIASYRKLQVV